MKHDVVIVPTLAQVEAWRRESALELRSGLFAQTVATFEGWIADLWELHGDGRRIIDPILREALVLSAASAYEQEHEIGLVGIAPVVVRCLKGASGVDGFEHAVDLSRRGEAVDGVSPRERDLLGVIAYYEDEIRERGVVEFGEAAALLTRDSRVVFTKPQHVLMEGVGSLTRIQEQFFFRCPQLTVDFDTPDGVSGVGRAPADVNVRFAFPAGQLAQPGLMADVLSSFGSDGNYVITCIDPLDLFERLEKQLSGQGFRLRVQVTKPFFQTDAGKAFLAVYQVLNEEGWKPSLLADAARNFFGGFSESEALRIDGMLRGNRIARRDEVVSLLCSESDAFSRLVEIVRGTNPSEHIAALIQRVQATQSRGGAWRAEQTAALGKLSSVIEAARIAEASTAVWADILGRASVAISAQSGTGADVLVTTQGMAASLPALCCNAVLLGDLTSESYPVADKDDAVSTLFEALGLKPDQSALERARQDFCSLLRLPTNHVVLFRPLGDANADETYPAAILEEFIDAYRDDPSNASEVDNEYRLPPTLQAGLFERGEELLFSNAYAADPTATQACEAEITPPSIDDLVDDMRGNVAPKRRDSSGNPISGLCPSPSQIELYLECPYQWFASRRLNLDTIDEGFGPLERGSFAHEAFEVFYRRFQEKGFAKVTEDTLDEARALMRVVTDELSAQQYEREPGSGRLVASSEIERREVGALCNQLVNYLDFEASLLPTFHPAYFEYEFDADHAVEYAGNRLVGKVDRIDVDDAGNAVIIDYKGSVNSEHEISGKLEAHCGKVQTRIYAQVVKRALGLNVVAALYVSYGRTPCVSGAYDPRVIEAAHLPGIRTEQCSCGLLDAPPAELSDEYSLASLAFDAMLDETEEIVSRAERAMARGVIAPNPAYPKACTYCPVLACPKRGA